MLDQLKNFQVSRADVYELVFWHKQAVELRAECEKLGIDEPDWLDGSIKNLKAAFRAQVAEKAASRRKEIEARLETLKTPGQRKSDLLKELKKLDELEALVS